MLITCTVEEPFEPPDESVAEPASDPPLSSPPHAASRPLAPLTAASAPAERVMNRRRVRRSSVPSAPLPPVGPTIPAPPVWRAAPAVASLLPPIRPGGHVLARVLSVVESCHGMRNRLSPTTARYSKNPNS